jgi:putative exporter of polyketide antibiotics
VRTLEPLTTGGLLVPLAALAAIAAALAAAGLAGLARRDLA